jgi:methyltransferase (TIGR00027 family)
MEEGTASRTARGVAAHRLDYDRVPAPYGNPAADEALTRDVAAGLDRPPGTRMHERLRARTAFFDQVVVTSIDRGITQVVIGAAGYDGRAYRYAKPGVRWFELDHPVTQADKRARIDRLGISGPHPVFAAADFTRDPVAATLRAAGLDPAAASLFLLEGIAVYLELPVLASVFADFREVAAPGSLLAISVTTQARDTPARQRFEQRVAELGEPVRSSLLPDEAETLLVAAGWQPTQDDPWSRSAGLLLARAATSPSASRTERCR